jgi:hypothetical protein
MYYGAMTGNLLRRGTERERVKKTMTTATAKADVTLDVRGVRCPLPQLKAIKALRQMEKGQVLEVVGPKPVWAQVLRNQLIGSDRDESGDEHFYLRKA